MTFLGFKSGFSERELHAMRFQPPAQYNGEVARGLLHTPEWAAKMAVLQEEFNRWAAEPDGAA